MRLPKKEFRSRDLEHFDTFNALIGTLHNYVFLLKYIEDWRSFIIIHQGTAMYAMFFTMYVDFHPCLLLLLLHLLHLPHLDASSLKSTKIG